MSDQKLADNLPSVPFGPHRLSRLIVGGNPFVANSHFSEQMNREMAEYFTPDKIVDTLERCLDVGINTFQGRGDYHRILYYLELLRRRGRKIQFIAQTASEMHDIHHNIRVIAAFGAEGIYFHGTATDKFWLEGKIDRVADYLKTIRDTGARVGMAAHIPEIFDYVEERGWDLDFYMTPFYNVARRPRESAVITGRFQEEEFNEEDPSRICRFIQATSKMCLAYKILACSRRCDTQETVRAAFRWAFARIKPGDCVVVGMYPRDLDQPRLNVQYTLEAIQAAEKEWVTLA
ncbi:MAG: hypothetical protein A3F83_14335 [Candidatus Glassbacteria bacterium RIFCSPLOWO2_12_FULL_58_11]|uniref:Radical SAM core domain-containing protein n=1 Tax=Candidatus Glassbacteria bacterium RIFCSPLOWO2_12_FULL_58_11 TaxID=1817867 RepID=A0A1F5YYI3_9BACT|nr:MAG: hypothetical protein A3F83_14335 [Candidatus Glassbacteria bacterium RIFCSPLOWO2_12_FULL_58_11]